MFDAVHALANQVAIGQAGIESLKAFIMPEGQPIYTDVAEAISRMVETVRHQREILNQGG